MASPIPAAIVNDTRADRHYGCYAVMATIDRLCAASGIEVVARVPVHHDWQADTALAERLSRVRLIIVNGEGTIHHDRPAAQRLVALGAFARTHGVVAALVNASWHANSPALAAAAGAFHRIAVRESASAAALAAAGIAAEVMPDLSIEGLSPYTGARAGTRVVGSVVPQQAWALARLRRRLGARPLSIFAPAADSVRAVRSDIAVAGARAPGVLAHAGDVARTFLDLRRGRVASPAAFEEAIGRAGLLITGRFHAALIALGRGTPVLALESNTGKISATLADAGLARWRSAGAEEITPALCAAAMTWSDTERTSLAAWRAAGVAAQRRLFAELAALAG